MMAASRGGGMKNRLPDYIDVECVKPGAKIKDLTNRVPEYVPMCIRPKRTTHVYAMAGINDVTERLESENFEYNYREVIFVEDPELVADRVCEDLEALGRAIKIRGAMPVFATITSANISKYNKSELDAGHTSFLYHSEHYENMQTSLNATIDLINERIKTKNRNNGVATPLCHNAIYRRRGRQTKYTVMDWARLRDGVHGTYATRSQWARSLKAAMDTNTRADAENMLGSPERSWRSEKRQKTS